MNKFSFRLKSSAAALCGFLIAPMVHADEVASPLREGSYIAPMVSYLFTDEKRVDNGIGGSLIAGFRRDWYALEISGDYYRVGAKSGHDLNQYGGSINGLAFPFSGSSSALAQNSYGIVKLGLLNNVGYPVVSELGNHENFVSAIAGAGLGQMIPLHVGLYDFALRFEAIYRYGSKSPALNNLKTGDSDAPHNFHDVLLSVGLQLPTAKRQPPPPPPPPPQPVVVPTPPDSDGDGVPDDRDQCPGTPAGTQVDEKGCSLLPPCKSPEPGRPIDLRGCAAGDKIVLRGVNFDFNKATLTPDAKTILDGVAEALQAVPQISVEIGGHTDAVGSDAYNQRLSERRAAAVVAYLKSKGIDAARLTSMGYGESEPVDSNETEEGREQNRRVELKITGGVPAQATASADVAPAAAEPAPADGAAEPDSLSPSP